MFVVGQGLGVVVGRVGLWRFDNRNNCCILPPMPLLETDQLHVGK
jgi:hypothetical protein